MQPYREHQYLRHGQFYVLYSRLSNVRVLPAPWILRVCVLSVDVLSRCARLEDVSGLDRRLDLNTADLHALADVSAWRLTGSRLAYDIESWPLFCERASFTFGSCS